MHLLDMYTREKVNKLHLDKMRRERPYHSLLRGMSSTKNIAISKRIRLVLIVAALALLLGAFLIPSIGRF
ncbi:MAG TPA: hypothetical protein VJM08_09485 [Anaerolineales bacterium]|nr:hypothetical protein [Anaerolineales bacterium]